MNLRRIKKSCHGDGQTGKVSFTLFFKLLLVSYNYLTILCTIIGAANL